MEELEDLTVEELDNVFKKYVESIDATFSKDAFSKESDNYAFYVEYKNYDLANELYTLL